MRNFNCFCCSEVFYTFEEFKAHIVKEHEQGKDYIICPLIRCQAPVRDIRAHFRACHQHDKIPKLPQMRALTWRDPKNPSKKKVPNFKEGFFTSKKNNKQIRYRSGYELDLYRALEKTNDVISYEAEPVAVEYHWQGSPRRYYPDLKVWLSDGRVQIWEVKPANQNNWDINIAKWTAARKFCAYRGWTFEVLNEAEIKALKKQVDIL